MRRNTTRTGLARKQRHLRYATRTWVDRLPDIPAFIIGNAPSLDDHDISTLEDYFTIGINRCMYRIDPTILMWQDISLWNTEYQQIHSTQAIKVSRDVSDPRKIYYNFYLKGGGYKFEPTQSHIFYGRGSTGPLAIQLAVAMGCRPIIILGMDCMRAEDGTTDFYGNNKHWTDMTEQNCLKGMIFVQEQCPVEIYNCTRSNLWPQVTLKEVLNTIDKQFKRGRQSYVRQILNISK